MLAKPTPPAHVVGNARRHDRPEAGAMAEDSKVRELMDDDGLERLGRRQDEAPREHQSAFLRGAPPPTPRIAQGDDCWLHPKGCSVAIELAADDLIRAFTEPVTQDLVERSAVARRRQDDQLVAVVIAAAGHAGPALTDRCATESQPVELAPVANEPTIDEAATPLQLLANALLALEVAAQPRLAFPEKFLDDGLRSRPTAACRERDRNDNSPARVHGDAEPTAAGHGPKRILDLSTGQPDAAGHGSLTTRRRGGHRCRAW